MQTMRVMWLILIVVFTGIVLFDLYRWSTGKENLRGLLPPLGMIFVGLGVIIRPRNRIVSYIFTGIALVLVISGLVLMLVY